VVWYYIATLQAVTWTLTPYATRCDARGDREGLRRIFVDGTRGTFFLAVALCAGMLLVGRDFLAVWMGEKYVSGVEYTSSATILAILAVAALARNGQGCGRQVLFAMRRVKLLSLVSLSEAVLNIALSIALVGPLGLTGVAIATLVSSVLLPGIVAGGAAARAVGVGPLEYLLVLVRSALPAAIPMAAVSLALDSVLTVDGWGPLVLKIALVGASGLVAGWLFVLSKEERGAIRSWIARR
jgi:O-antigen/teichoic acid export membrane protein